MVSSFLLHTAPPYSPPQILDTSSESSVPFGVNLALQVENYTGQVQWWFNGAALTSNSSRYEISQQLILRDTDFNHSGVYQAEVLDITPPPFVLFLIEVTG